MPIFDYKCQECGEVSEIFVNQAGNKAIICPICGSEKMERLISASYLLQTETRAPGRTCCGRTERCETPPCSIDGTCRKS